MDIQTFLAGVLKNADRITAYQLGCDGTDGKSDCIGLIIGALRWMGETWEGTHGSNYAARYEMRTLDKMSGEHDLVPGQLVFKCREKGEKNYALPDRYKHHADSRDYYHVGVVTNVNPLCILHCSSGGMHRDTDVGAWRFAGFLQKVSQEQALYTAVITSENGGRVHVRTQPDVKSARILSLLPGAEVEVLDESHAHFYRVRTNGKTGYVMRPFLRKAEERVTFSLDAQTAKALFQALSQALKFS